MCRTRPGSAAARTLGGSFGSRPWPVNRLITSADIYGREAQEILRGKQPCSILSKGLCQPGSCLVGWKNLVPVFFGLIRDRTHPMIYRRPRILNELDLCLELRASPGSLLLSIKNKCWLCLFWTICLSSLGRFP